MRMTKEEQRKYMYRIGSGFAVLALAILLYFFLFRFESLKSRFYQIQDILMPFIYGAVLAYLLRMPSRFLEKRMEKYLPGKTKKFAGGLAIVCSIAGLFLVINLLLSMVVPELVKSIATVFEALPGAIDRLSAWIKKTLEGNEVLGNYVQTAIAGINEKLQVWSKTDLMPMLQGMMSGVTSTVSSVVRGIVNLMIGLVVCVYLLNSRKLFARQGKAVLYSIFNTKWADRIYEEILYADKSFAGFFSGKLLDSTIIGLICYVFCLIFRFPDAMLVSVIVGVTNIIPYFGPYIGAIPSFLLILMVDPVKAFEFLVFIIILQQFDGNILGPKLLADSTGLSGFWVLFSITFFGGVLGFVGILIGVPLFAVIYDIIRKLVRYGLKKHHCEDLLQGGGSE